MTRKEIRAIRKSVGDKVSSGALRAALEANPRITERQRGSVVVQASRHRWIKNEAVANGEVRSALVRVGWTEYEIDFLLYRSRSTIYDDETKAA